MNSPPQSLRLGISRRARVWSLLAIAALLACREQPQATIGQIVEAQSLGNLYLDENKLPEAEAAFKRLVKLTPDDVDARLKLALVYLRMDRPSDAEKEIREAIERAPGSVDAHLLLASVNERNGKRDAAASDLTRLTQTSPVDPRVYYALVELARSDPDSARRRAAERDALRQLVAQQPANVPARLEFAQSLVATGAPDSALGQLEALRQVPPAPPKEAKPALDRAIRALRARDLAGAAKALDELHASLESTVPFQTALNELRGPQITLTGMPAVTLPRPEVIRDRLMRDSSAPAVTFEDVTSQLLPAAANTAARTAAMTTGDVDGDGVDEIFAALGATTMLLHRSANETQMQDVASGAPVQITANAAAFGDADNDGFLDLVIIDQRDLAWFVRNDGKGHFEKPKQLSGVYPGTTRVRFVDLDHDGDLDLLLATENGPKFLRNNGDGAFMDVTQPAGLAVFAPAFDVAFGDFDDDGLLDVLTSAGPPGAAHVSLLLNDRVRGFRDLTGSWLANVTGDVLAVGDYDNDGYLDVFVASSTGGAPTLLRNANGERFEHDARSARDLAALKTLNTRAALFVDFDNDGRLDLVVAGESRAGSSVPSVRLYRNNGAGRFVERLDALPANLATVTSVVANDVDRDRDLDLVVAGPSGVRVLQNRGGNRNLAVEVALTGLTTGSGKNNVFGIGSRLEVRAGDLYAMRLVTDQRTLVGLGSHVKADAIRVEWPNGVPQTLYYPGSDQDILENQVLKSSCAFVYAWDGDRFEFVTDAMWRSALGMPVGIGGAGSASFAPAGASREYVKLPRGALVPYRGAYRMQFTEELWETSYTDAVQLVAVDHPDTSEVAVDERFVPPGPPVTFGLYRAHRVRPPRSIVDERGNDLLPLLRDADFAFASDLEPDRYQGIMRSHDLVIGLDSARSDRTLLMLRGWVFPTDASINVALTQGSFARADWPVLDVQDSTGRWRKLSDLSIPSGKNKVIVEDLSGRITAADRRLRVRTNLAIYWDQVSFADKAQDSPVRVTTLKPRGAEVHYRGFSRMYRKGGRYGPHWFDYAQVTTQSPWRPIAGEFTRYGDVTALLLQDEAEYVVMAPGDEMTVEFDAHSLPPLPAGWMRDVFLYSVGWIKDADFNTAHGGTVTPLPFHGMTRYPYGDTEHYPADASHQRYLSTYNTRPMTTIHSSALRDARGRSR